MRELQKKHALVRCVYLIGYNLEACFLVGECNPSDVEQASFLISPLNVEFNIAVTSNIM